MRNLFPAYFPLFVIVLLVLARRPINLLRKRGAVSPETAQPVDDLSASDRRRFDRWKAQGIIREAAPGHYYYDAAAERARARARMPWLIGLAVLLFLVAAALFYWERTHVQPLP